MRWILEIKCGSWRLSGGFWRLSVDHGCFLVDFGGHLVDRRGYMVDLGGYLWIMEVIWWIVEVICTVVDSRDATASKNIIFLQRIVFLRKVVFGWTMRLDISQLWAAWDRGNFGNNFDVCPRNLSSLHHSITNPFLPLWKSKAIFVIRTLWQKSTNDNRGQSKLAFSIKYLKYYQQILNWVVNTMVCGRPEAHSHVICSALKCILCWWQYGSLAFGWLGFRWNVWKNGLYSSGFRYMHVFQRILHFECRHYSSTVACFLKRRP